MGREIKRNPTRFGHYGWRVAQESADIRKERLPGNRRIDDKVLKEAPESFKDGRLVPMQISGFLSLKPVRISHGTIYKRIRGDESGELRSHCRHKMKYELLTGLPGPTGNVSGIGRWILSSARGRKAPCRPCANVP